MFDLTAPRLKNTRRALPNNLLMDAGIFSSWLYRVQKMLINEDGIDVPCGECVGCCSSSQFIHIRPQETKTLSRIPRKLLFSAPLLPKGHMVLGYDETGHCPMFIKGKCSIYEHRPLTCRNYDCRIFSAAGIVADDDDKGLINKQVQHWQFKYPNKLDQILHSAVKSAASFIRSHPVSFPEGKAPVNASQLAVVAIKVCTVFLEQGCDPKGIGGTTSDKKTAKTIIAALKKFNAGR